MFDVDKDMPMCAIRSEHKYLEIVTSLSGTSLIRQMSQEPLLVDPTCSETCAHQRKPVFSFLYSPLPALGFVDTKWEDHLRLTPFRDEAAFGVKE